MYHIITNTIIFNAGPTTDYLAQKPKDKHLFRLAILLSSEECFTIINKLITLKHTIWEEMKVQYEYNMALHKFFGFLEWTKLMCKYEREPLLQDLFDVLEDVNDIHLLCQVSTNCSDRCLFKCMVGKNCINRLLSNCIVGNNCSHR